MSTKNVQMVRANTNDTRATRWFLICTVLVFFISSWFTAERPIVIIVVPILIWLFVRSLRSPIPQPQGAAVLLAALALLVYDFVAPRIVGQGHPDRDELVMYSRLVDLGWILITGVLAYRLRQSRESIGRWRVAIVAAAAISSSILIVITPAPTIDVWHLHQEAGEALFNGANPYTDIQVFSSFDADEATRLMTGYPYSPPNLIGFGASAALTGESRWFSAACWIAFLAVFALLRPRSSTGTALLLFMASQPAWYVVLEIAYTESLTLLLLGGVILAWRFRKTVGALLLGVALASKQYLVVLAPMILGARLLPRRTRVVSLIMAAATVGAGFLWATTDYLDAIVGFHLRVPPQDHSVNLYGLSAFFGAPFLVPSIVGIVASVLVGLLSAHRARTPSQLLIGAASALGIGFFLATQAFVNYWFLVGGILCLALLLAEPEETPSTAMSVARNGSSAVNA